MADDGLTAALERWRNIADTVPDMADRSHWIITGDDEKFIDEAKAAMPLLVAAVEAVLELAAQFNSADDAYDRAVGKLFMEAITRELTGKE